jgi:hypothetical protein
MVSEEPAPSQVALQNSLSPSTTQLHAGFLHVLSLDSSAIVIFSKRIGLLVVKSRALYLAS